MATAEVNASVERIIKDTFGFQVDAVTLTTTAYKKIADALPDNWIHGKSIGCNVMFLWADIDTPDIVEKLPAKPGIDTVIYVPGAILWAFDGKDVNKTGIAKLTGIGPSQRMTIRTATPSERSPECSIEPSRADEQCRRGTGPKPNLYRTDSA